MGFYFNGSLIFRFFLQCYFGLIGLFGAIEERTIFCWCYLRGRRDLSRPGLQISLCGWECVGVPPSVPLSYSSVSGLGRRSFLDWAILTGFPFLAGKGVSSRERRLSGLVEKGKTFPHLSINSLTGFVGLTWSHKRESHSVQGSNVPKWVTFCF